VVIERFAQKGAISLGCRCLPTVGMGCDEYSGRMTATFLHPGIDLKSILFRHRDIQHEATDVIGYALTLGFAAGGEGRHTETVTFEQSTQRLSHRRIIVDHPHLFSCLCRHVHTRTYGAVFQCTLLSQ